jgi:hypothetical protein
MHTPHAEPEALQIVLTTKEVSALSPLQMQDVLHYMFKYAPRHRRIEVAEIAFRYNRTHCAGLALFLAAVLPLAERAARRRAVRAFHLSDWKFEAMYDAALAAAIEMFQRGPDVRDTEENVYAIRKNDTLRELLSEPITSEEAEALRDAVMKRARVDVVIEWLRDSTLSWRVFHQDKQYRKLKVV